jgi:hypothetical protein
MRVKIRHDTDEPSTQMRTKARHDPATLRVVKRPWAKSPLNVVPGQEGVIPLHLMLREVKKKRSRRNRGSKMMMMRLRMTHTCSPLSLLAPWEGAS